MGSCGKKRSYTDSIGGKYDKEEEEKEFIPLRITSIASNEVKPYGSTRPEESGATSQQRAENRVGENGVGEHAVNENSLTPSSPDKECFARLNVAQTRASYGIQVEGSDVPPPLLSFKDMGLPTSVLEELGRQGVIDPSPIQMQAIPCLLQGRDVIALAETGSGKSLAYVLPLLMRLHSKPAANAGDGPTALIIVPSRELVDQVYTLVARFFEIINYGSRETVNNLQQVSNLDQDASTTRLSAAATAESLSRRQAPLPSLPPPLPLPPPPPSPLLAPPSLPPPRPLSSALEHPLPARPPVLSHATSLPRLPLFPHGFPQAAAAPASSSLPMLSLPEVTQLPLADFHTELCSVGSRPAWESSQHVSSGAEFLYAVGSTKDTPGSGSHDCSPQLQPERGCTIANTSVLDQRSEGPQISPSLPWRKALGVVGGVDIFPQIQALRRGVDVLIATPGRLIDLLERKEASLNRVCFLVLDEADKMMGEGMEEQLRKVLNSIPGKGCQALLVTATMPIGVERLAISCVVDPITITTGDPNTTVESVTQEVIFVHSFGKRSKLLQVLRSTEFPPVLVFCSSRETVDSIVKLLRSEQFHVAGLHSGKSQTYRFRCMRAFKDGGVDVLVATDLASRGIDCHDVRRVINYDMPDSIETYIHRCGRTARMGSEGIATSFLSLDCKIAKELRQLLQKTDQVIPQELHDLRQFGGKVVRTEFGDIAMRT
ncbi:hypothetical protein CBR_g38940 [Chara braunii]|uniref:RNA helicase n=1 Tax=Chara braunii TaxID=69332 RepID=A0A388K0Q6_CHABU|nr:hypothetical protein CBR_g38940 [Chara braunii]|eukprot:GBG63629.1 hypothetical protein CBR_g38940 [Chara braunii]